MTDHLSTGDLVSVEDNDGTSLVFRSRHYVVDGDTAENRTVALEGLAGRYLARRFEKVPD